MFRLARLVLTWDSAMTNRHLPGLSEPTRSSQTFCNSLKCILIVNPVRDEPRFVELGTRRRARLILLAPRVLDRRCHTREPRPSLLCDLSCLASKAIPVAQAQVESVRNL
ncbi:MAG: hypothetical protein JWO91_1099 [Acidobacteriaceae bacterium]|nr:hypothetical protein [Acidobacteriaceae bacterium]